jgi:NADH-quinone oxidoreductase subunit H
MQSLADTLKLLVKEGLTPNGADKLLFNLAPFIAMIVAMLLMAPIAFAKRFSIVGFEHWGTIYICDLFYYGN